MYAISPFDLFSMLWMFSPACAIAVEIWPTMFGTFALAIAMRYGDSRAMSTAGKFTALRIVAVLEEVAQLVHDHDRAVVLGLPGGRAKVRQREHAGMALQARRWESRDT